MVRVHDLVGLGEAMSKPWLETWWKKVRVGDSVSITNDGGTERARAICRTPSSPWADIVAAAPDMCRALLAAEWAASCPECDSLHRICPWCKDADPSEGAVHPDESGHHDDCGLDAALTKAGLPDQASRDAARKEIWL